MTTEEHLHGLLLGTAIGDSVGLPAEGLSPRAIAKLGWDKTWKQRFFLGRGMWSDDTEHTIILTQALLASDADPKAFQKRLARDLRFWLAMLPAGVGLATARSIFKLWLGISPDRSGVFSAGNGPMMRAAPIGCLFSGSNKDRLIYNRHQTRITHSDPKAEHCARAIVELTALFCQSNEAPSQEKLFDTLLAPESSDEFRELINCVRNNLAAGEDLDALLSMIGARPKKGVSGYCFHTLAAVLHCGIRHQWKPEQALPAIWSAGGDTDTSGAILGALCGTLHGASSFPENWLAAIAEWPLTPSSLSRLADSVAAPEPLTIRPLFHPALLFRNFIFLLIVLSHGFRRLLPILGKSELSASATRTLPSPD
ncbi:ADP-ribosylglycohydrolase family protein [Roseibacillus ishigakijimensis]|uniref:ADP-ribosylglycohydrolase family protein n=1 Tax=Roseibacillus ishigakijimensis TaxID=454146 RepID=A0A934VN70_9BACT|nr:ADP-ribosylglycohydrolase family protein [Roseibacillus ishigakijimensis]MBK1834811.1 ADP-ribosylglycohydrolase family protein [Roseibacillus ishigakijimensis]